MAHFVGLDGSVKDALSTPPAGRADNDFLVEVRSAFRLLLCWN